MATPDMFSSRMLLLLLVTGWGVFEAAESFVSAPVLCQNLSRIGKASMFLEDRKAARFPQGDDRTAPERLRRWKRRRRDPLDAMKATATESAEYLKEKEALKRDLRQEYESFFDQFQSERYLPDVQFIDPVTRFSGFKNYKNNVDLLGGRTLLGRILFKDAKIVLHDIEEPAPFRLRTRWTLSLCFKALPWQPVPRFTGISDYTLDRGARVIKQEDFWDSVNLVEGRYLAVSSLEGVKDFVGQVLPGPRDGGLGGLLRRGKDYDVRRTEGGKVMASRDFDETPTRDVVQANKEVLQDCLLVDGLKTSGEIEVVTPGARLRHQVRVALREHDWIQR